MSDYVIKAETGKVGGKGGRKEVTITAYEEKGQVKANIQNAGFSDQEFVNILEYLVRDARRRLGVIRR